MRKQYKRKLRSCALCKPHKVGWESRWKPKERQALKLSDAAMRVDYVHPCPDAVERGERELRGYRRVAP